MHVPIMVHEVLEALALKPGNIVVDGTLGYGGHAREILKGIAPNGRLLALDVDPIELPRTEARLRGLGFDSHILTVHRSNFAGLPAILAAEGLTGVDGIFLDLGVSSMQIDTPERGFSVKTVGPLDMRMNPNRGRPASALLAEISATDLESILREHADEPQAHHLGVSLAGRDFAQTNHLADAIREALPRLSLDEMAKTTRRVFQALRIEVNEEFTALEMFLRHARECLNPGGRIVILTFHSGEDRRVKKRFQSGFREGEFSKVCDQITRASAAECRLNPRATSAKLRWAER